MNKESAKDLLFLFFALGVIIAVLIIAGTQFRDPTAGENRDWYYERIAPPGTRRPR